MDKYAIIVAGGSGKRFKSSLPKQFVELEKKPILMRSIEAFYLYQCDIKLIVVLPKDQIDYWTIKCEQYSFNIRHFVVEGGEVRFQSVKNGLNLVKDESLVAIHDGVRPLIDRNTIERCFSMAEMKGNAIPMIDLVDTVREIQENGKNLHVDRNRFKLIQTPQVFRSDMIKKAYEQTYKDSYTDDASVLEDMMPGIIQLVEGNRRNLKITTPEDLIYAEAILKSYARE